MSSSTNITIPMMEPPIAGIRGWPFTKLPLRWRSDEHEYISAMPKLEDDNDDFVDLDAVYVAPNLQAQVRLGCTTKRDSATYSVL